MFALGYRSYFKLICCVALAGCGVLSGESVEGSPFTLVTYNVENLFDADGVAAYEDYRPATLTSNPHPYTARKVLTKLQNIVRVVGALNHGLGPEIIAFQELERDATPDETPGHFERLKQRFAGQTVAELLTQQPLPSEVADLPSAFLLYKALEDANLCGYQVAVAPDTRDADSASVQQNVVFSRFPLKYESSSPTPGARPIQHVVLDVSGHDLHLINVHWKSGASTENQELVRVTNAADTRALVDRILAEQPYADIIVTGDFNTHYNAPQVFRNNWSRFKGPFAIEILRSGGDERFSEDLSRGSFYNLWFELPAEQRGSDAYRGSWGTLMQMNLSAGLYDQNGIQYVDNSFRVHILPSINTSGPFRQPRSWQFAGETGSGFSDHFPIYAQFRVTDQNRLGEPMVLENPSIELNPPSTLPKLDWASLDLAKHSTDGEQLGKMTVAELSENLGNVFEVRGRPESKKTLIVKVGKNTFDVYAYQSEAKKRLDAAFTRQKVSFYAELTEYHGRLQLVVHEPDWVKTR